MLYFSHGQLVPLQDILYAVAIIKQSVEDYLYYFILFCSWWSIAFVAYGGL